jgi:IS5 family transposase
LRSEYRPSSTRPQHFEPFGYKKHHITDDEGLVLGVLTTKTSVDEISNLEEVLATANLPENIPLKADKGYQSEKNEALLKKLNL